jgi:hypothetical protein
MLTAEKILKAQDLSELEKVDVPEWGDFVYVRKMNGMERDRWELMTSKAVEKPMGANVRASLCAMTICDEKGKRLFTDNQMSALGAKSAIALDRIFAVSKDLNKLNDDDIEELEKNSLAAVPVASGSK